MIKHLIITGDTHGGPGTITRINNIAQNNPELKPEETGIIILGDCGLNFYLNKTDKKYKKYINDTGYQIYCVRGNHEERPQNVQNIYYTYDAEVNGYLWKESEFPNINYFADYGEYNICGRSIAVIGGAYSVDKEWRLQSGNKWFSGEQLTTEERDNAWNLFKGKEYDFVFSHTCPLSWQPTDLFLSFIDQSKVDNSMEKWLEEIKNKFSWKIWLWGHYHKDRVERPHCEMLYTGWQFLDDIYNRWCGAQTYKQEWWLNKSPNYYFQDNPWSKTI